MMMPDPHEFTKPFGWLTKLLARIAAVDCKLLSQSPPRDWAHVRATGVILILSFALESALLTLVGENVFAYDHFSPAIMAAAIFVAFLITTLDSQILIASTYHVDGLAELARAAGLDLTGGMTTRIKMAILVIIRLTLSIGIALLVGEFFCMIVFQADINEIVEAKFHNANAQSVAAATGLVDGAIATKTQEVKNELARHETLAGQIDAVHGRQVDPLKGDPQAAELESELSSLNTQKAAADADVMKFESMAADEKGGIAGTGTSGVPGAGLKYHAAQEKIAAARAHAANIDRSISETRGRLENLRARIVAGKSNAPALSNDQIAGLESGLVGEDARLKALQDELSALTASRAVDITKAVEAAPDYVKIDRGFLAQMAALDEIAAGNPRIHWLIIVFEFIAGALELGAVLGKTIAFNPTTYSALLAADVYRSSVRIVDDLEADLDESGKNAAMPKIEVLLPPRPSNDNPKPSSGSGNGTGPSLFGGPSGPPPKRPRGRPRKDPSSDSKH
jgi:hypothetical protein